MNFEKQWSRFGNSCAISAPLFTSESEVGRVVHENESKTKNYSRDELPRGDPSGDVALNARRVRDRTR